MNGGQDLGGAMGFGPINPEIDEPYFHADWERKVLALTLAMGATGTWNIDTSRHARENVDPGLYLTWSYYRIWLEGLQKLLIQFNLANSEEISKGQSQQPPTVIKQVLLAENVESTLVKGSISSRATETIARYQIGDLITTENINPNGHTRLARYLRGHKGEIVDIHGFHVFPDSSAHELNGSSQWLYSVRFSATELWGGDARDGDCVHADLWEPYLTPNLETKP
jgi:nitrile hydratase beta subunit